MKTLNRYSFSLLSPLILASLLGGTSFAEIIYKIPSGFGWQAGLPLHLLEAEAVQKDLGLSADKAYKLSQWRATVDEAINSEAASIKDRIKRREVLQRIQPKFQSELDGILSSDQQNRLHQIDLQMQRLESLSDRAVAKGIELSPEQQAKILSIHKRMLQEEKASIQGGRSSDFLSMSARDKLLIDVLSSAQKEKFDQMKGIPFDASGFLPTLRLRDKEFEIWNVAFSPDGKRLASSRKNEIYLWDAETGQAISRMQGHSANITSFCFGPDGKWIISASADRTVKSWDVESGNNILSHGSAHSAFAGRFIPGTGAECFRSIALSPDGTHLAHANGTTVSISNNINPLVPPFLKASETYPGGIMEKLPVWSVAFNPDGKRQACGRIDGSVYLLGFGMPRKIVAATDAVFCVAFSPDGQQLATASADGSVKVWSVSDGGELASLQSHEQAARCVIFSPDASLVASAGDDGVVRISALRNPSEPAVLLTHRSQATGISFSADGKRIASTGSDGLVRIWNVKGEELLVLGR